MSAPDISANQNPLSAYVASEDELLQAWLECTPGSSLLCQGHVIAQANAEAAELLGAESPSWLSGRSLLAFLGASEQAKAEAYLQKAGPNSGGVLLSFAVFGRPAALLLKVGKPLPGRTLRLVQLTPAGEEETRQRLALILESIDLGLFYCDLPFSTLTWNNRCREHFGLGPNAKVTIDLFYELIHPDDRELTRDAIEGSIEKKTVYDITYRTLGQDGVMRWIRAIGQPFYDAGGSPIRFDGVTVNVTDHLAAEAALRESERQLQEAIRDLKRTNDDLNQFAYIAHHDLQEPLRMIASYSQLLQRRYGGQLDAASDQYINYVVDGAKRMSLLLQDLLAYSLATAGPDNFVSMSMQEAADATVRNLRPTLLHAGAKVIFSGLPTVNANKQQVLQLLENLISNAIKYRGEEPLEIQVSAQEQEDRWLFTVADNGIGIAKQYHDRIFGLFKRLHGRKYPGTGIGLAICQKVVERHGGRIWVDSEPDKGARFHFTLKRSHAEGAPYSTPKS